MLVFCLVDPGDIVEADSLPRARRDSPRRTTAEGPEDPPLPAPVCRRKIQMKNPIRRIVGRKPSTSEANSDRPSSGGSALITTFSSASSRGELGRVDERGDFRLELGDGDRVSVAGRFERRLAPQLALDGVRP